MPMEHFINSNMALGQKHSTNQALINITEKIRQALDQGKSACGVFVDFQKAFDTVDHNILLKKIHHYGIRGPMYNWFKSYLLDREQYVSILGYDSCKSKIAYMEFHKVLFWDLSSS